MNETRYPLCWPAAWKRTANRTRAQFGRVTTVQGTNGGSWTNKNQITVPQGFERVQAELERLHVSVFDVIVSTNVVLNLSGAPHGGRGEPSDTGVAVYWKSKGKSQCMAIDRYDRVADNLAAVAATLEALRAIERHGGGPILDRAFMGFAQLPAAIVTGRSWREVLGFQALTTPTIAMVNDHWRDLAQEKHPDKSGGSHDAMSEINAARAAAIAELKN